MFEAVIETAGVTAGVTVIVMEPDVAVDGLAHDSEEVMTQVTTSPLLKVELL